MRSKEAVLDDKQREQKMIEEQLKQREAELAEREIDLLQRELNVMILQQQGAAGVPTPKKRKGNFKKSRLKLLKNKASSDSVNQSSASMISAPLGMSLILFGGTHLARSTRNCLQCQFQTFQFDSFVY